MFRKPKNRITLAEVLRGCTPGRIQSVGYMQVIPLVSDLSDDRFLSPAEAEAEVCTSNYGTLGFRNPSDRVMIVPCHAGYVVKQAAQDHAMAHAGLVQPSARRQYDTAMCVQQTQGGLIAAGNHRMLILPYALREPAMKVRNERSYNKLWDAISRFNSELDCPPAGNLEFFLKNFRKELDGFVAEFECVPNQLGAIVLVDDQVVGVERAPSHAYWRSVWPALIRECYGSAAIRVAKQRGQCPPASREPLPDDVETLDDLEAVIAAIAEQEEERTKATVRQILMSELSLKREEAVAGVTIETVESEQFTGQVIRDGEHVVYASLPVVNSWVRSKRWQTAKPFVI